MSFSSFKAERLPSILARSDCYDEQYRHKARVAFERLNPGPTLHPKFDGLVGASTGEIKVRQASAADGQARTMLRKRLVNLIRRFHRGHPEYAFYFGTVIHADWHTNSQNTLIDLADMQDRMRNVVRMCGFKGAVMMLEIQAAPGAPRDESWEFFPHGHFIAWAERPFDKRKAGRRVRSSKRLRRPEGARTLVLSKEIAFKSDLLRRAAYLVKEPYSGKKRGRRTGRFERTIQDMHPEVCLRLTEVLSYLRISELLLLSGEATVLRKELMAPVPATFLSHNRYEAPAIMTARFWDSARAKGTRFYPPVQLIRKLLPRAR